jgi:hypothetical protein
MQTISEQYARLDRREILLITAALFMVGLMILSQFYSWVDSKFEEQAAEIEQLENDAQTVSAMLQRYVRLRSRRDEIEASYKQVEIKEGALSLLESLIRTKANVPTGFTIKDNPPRQFGGNYEQVPFSVKFPISNLPKLVEFLQEVLHGAKPMVVTRLDLRKQRNSDRMDVDMDVSSFRRTR